MLRTFDDRLGPIISHVAAGSYETAVRDAFVICECELRARWEARDENRRTNKPATELAELWFRPEGRGVHPFPSDAGLAAFRRFSRASFEAGRNPAMHGAVSLTDAATAFCWLAVINLILVHVDGSAEAVE
jgi:hypothetical protein